MLLQQLCLVPQENGDRCHCFWPTYSIAVKQREREGEGGKKPPRKEIRYRVFPGINRIGRRKSVTSIHILLEQYRQLLYYNTLRTSTVNIFMSPPSLKYICVCLCLIDLISRSAYLGLETIKYSSNPSNVQQGKSFHNLTNGQLYP